VRAGGVEGLRARMVDDATWTPDAGPALLHESAGAVAIGARPFLGAFNVYVGGADALDDAKAIARTVRAANGGVPGLKALGLLVHDEAQVSMNVTDLAQIPLHVAFDAVDAAARALGRRAAYSELIGLVPQASLESTFADRIRLRDSRATVSLEQRIHATRVRDDLRETADAIASLDLPQASGTAASLTAMLASATVRLAAGVHVARANTPAAEPLRRVLTSARMLEQHLQTASHDDADAWQQVLNARRLPRATPADMQERARQIDAALLAATDVPLRIARLACDVVALAAEAAEYGDHVTAPDAWAAASLAHGAVQAALGLARANVAMLAQPTLGLAAEHEARQLAGRAESYLAHTKEHALPEG
jgi:glutamate formiminotransferase / formiminotetrahydrofolate cyclodeaminase